MTKSLAISLFFVLACKAGVTSIGNQPTILAIVQHQMPGNIMADDVPESMQPKPHYSRRLFVLLPEQTTLQIDSVVYQNIAVATVVERMEERVAPIHLGNSIPGDKRIVLSPSKGKSWWSITISEDDERIRSLPAITMPVKIFVHSNSDVNSWVVDTEIEVTGPERY